MEDLIIKKFLNYGSGSGFGFGSGDGSDSGSGSGSGDGSGFGFGSGPGFGFDSGSGSSYGYGDGSGYKINNDMVYDIDGVDTILKSIKNNVAKGYIVNDNLTLTKTYIVKHNNLFAHGETLGKAIQSLEEKIMSNMDSEEVIEIFLEKTELNKSYPTQYFFEWHGKLTGSCLQGRETFVKNNEIDLDADMTITEFIDICKNAYGSEVIKMLEERVKEVNK